MLLMTEREARDKYRDYAMNMLFLDLDEFMAAKYLSFTDWITEHKITIKK